MPKTDAEIKRQLRDLLAAANKRKGKRTNRFGCLAFVLALPIGAVLGGFFAALFGFGETAGAWSVLIGGAVALAATAMLAVRDDDKQAARLAARFRTVFSEETGDFDAAVALLRQVETDSKIEKDLIKALDVTVKFADSPTEPPKMKAEDPFEAFKKKGALAGLPTAFAIKSKEDLFDFLEKHPNLSGTFSEGPLQGNKGFFKTVKVVSSYSSKSDVGPAEPKDQLLGDFEPKQGTPPRAKTESDKPAGTDASRPEPSDEPPRQYIPLDPYDRPPEADDAAETESETSKNTKPRPTDRGAQR